VSGVNGRCGTPYVHNPPLPLVAEKEFSARKLQMAKTDVVVVCCGAPKVSMGWFHLTQLLEHEAVTVSAVVEPYFMGPGHGKSGSESFDELVKANPEVVFCASIGEVPAATGDAGAPRLFLIAGRTCDAKRLFMEALEAGATHIYIEKPAGESAAQLREMKAAADARNVSVVVGYNKNVAAYTRDALAALLAVGEGAPLPRVTLMHCNEFMPGEPLLAFLRGPGGEGMLHNMCCHELALACTLFGVSADRVTSIVLDPNASELIDLGDGRSDWSRVTFTLKLAEMPADAPPPPPGSVRVDELTFSADRCGGNFSKIVLTDASSGHATSEFRLPSPEHEAWIMKAQKADPLIRPYFLQQAPDYERLKNTFLSHIGSGKAGIPDGVVGLEGAIDALTLADMLVPAIKQCWADGAPWTWHPPASADAKRQKVV
jgi:predicted dehydrogenase